jgi:hypothetical protein
MDAPHGHHVCLVDQTRYDAINNLLRYKPAPDSFFRSEEARRAISSETP